MSSFCYLNTLVIIAQAMINLGADIGDKHVYSTSVGFNHGVKTTLYTSALFQCFSTIKLLFSAQ